jgi:elongation factor 1-gamma
MTRAVAAAAGVSYDYVILSAEEAASKDFKAKSATGKFPMLETPEGNLNESLAIAKYFAHGHATLLGANNVERAQIDQWCYWMISKVVPQCFGAVYSIFGMRELDQASFNEGSKAAKELCREVEKHLTGDWLVGSKATLADYVVGLFMAPLFQTMLDAGFRKAAPKTSAWFARVVALDAVVKTHGHIKPCAKALKPLIKKEEKKVAPKKQEAAKPKDAAPKKDVDPCDLLPESSFDLYNFKTLFVNHTDKSGGGVDELMKQIDLEGYSMWFFHYDKYKGEGEKLYMTENLMQGFLQRFDHYRKHAFARMCILGEEPSLEIEGVWLFRGQEIPRAMHDHPQFEYYSERKMDLSNEADLKLVREFWGGALEGVANGMKIQSIAWHK